MSKPLGITEFVERYGLSSRDIGLLSGLAADDIQYLLERPNDALPPHVAALITLWVHSREVGRERALSIARRTVTPLRTLKQAPDRDGYLPAACVPRLPRATPTAPANLYWGTARDNAQDAVRHAAERAANLRAEPRKTAANDRTQPRPRVQNPYKGLTTNQIRELYALKKISKGKAIELIEKRLGRS